MTIVAYDASVIKCGWCSCASVLQWWIVIECCLHVRWTVWIEIFVCKWCIVRCIEIALWCEIVSAWGVVWLRIIPIIVIETRWLIIEMVWLRRRLVYLHHASDSIDFFSRIVCVRNRLKERSRL